MSSTVDRQRLIKTSKYLARHLRHSPERLGLTLDPGGWVLVEDLLRACAGRAFDLSSSELREVVELNDKRRFSFDATGVRIRANQGHSVPIDLQLSPSLPPRVLFHGTGRKSLDSILRFGLDKMQRHHVHLSVDTTTALNVGARHGSPVVLEVAANRMAAEGYVFYVTDNEVWLTAEVPVHYLTATCLGDGSSATPDTRDYERFGSLVDPFERRKGVPARAGDLESRFRSLEEMLPLARPPGSRVRSSP